MDSVREAVLRFCHHQVTTPFQPVTLSGGLLKAVAPAEPTPAPAPAPVPPKEPADVPQR